MSLFDSASLVVTPNGYKEGTLYSIKPTSGAGDLSVTRATSARRFNSDGLIELVPYNLLQQSQTFENASWGKSAVGINTSIGTSGIQSNIANAPNGTLTADRVNFLLQSDLDLGLNQNYYLDTANQSFVGSIYVKGEGSNIGKQIKLRIKRTTGGSFVTVDTTITLTSDWVEIRSSVLTLLTNNTGVQYIISSSDATNALIWGAQLVTGTSAKEYFPTTDRLNIPRLDYTNGTCPSILVEPQRTNLALRSEEFDNASWIKSGLTITANSFTAPSGNLTADTITPSISDAILRQSFVPTGAVQYTFSVWLRSTTGSNFSTTLRCWRDSPFTNVANTVINVTTQWQRFTFTFTSLDSSSHTIAIGGSSTLSIGENCNIWGAQLEAGSNATSYIPTTSASVTRNADVISKTGISSLIGQTEGTIFCEINNTLRTYQEGYLIRLFADANNEVWIRKEGGTNTYSARFRANSVNVYTKLDINVLNGNNKIAFAYKSGDLAIYLNGVQIGTSTSTGAFSATVGDLNLGYTSTAFFNDRIKSAILFKTRLSNTELAQLTTI